MYSVVYAQISFTCTTEPDVLYANEPFVIKYVAQGKNLQISKFIQPFHKNLQYLDGPVHSIEKHNINGKKTEIFYSQFLVTVNKTGDFILPEAQIIINEQVFTTKPLLLKLHKNKTASKAPNRKVSDDMPPDYWPQNKDERIKLIHENLYIEAVANKETCYVGEPIIVTFNEFSRLKASGNITKIPSFNGFSVTDIPLEIGNYFTDTIQNKVFNVYPLRKVQLIPLQTGNLQIEPTVAEHQVLLLNKQHAHPMNPADMMSFSIPQEFVVTKSIALNIEVLPLPQPSPENFTGTVGNLLLSAQVQQKNMEANREGQLVVEIVGNGNIKLINAPVIQWPENIEQLENKTKDVFNFKTVPAIGKRTFYYTFIVSKPGLYNIPSVSIAVFNPTKKQYEQLSTQPINIEVLPESGTPYVKTSPVHTSNVNRNYIIIGFLALCIVSVIFIYFIGKHKKRSAPQTVPLSVFEESTSIIRYPYPFPETRKTIQHANTREFYSALNKELKHVLTNYLNLNEQTVPSDIIESLSKQGIEHDTLKQLYDLFNLLEQNLYAPFIQETNTQNILEETEQMVKQIIAFDPPE
jgi:hypothetical protein